MINELGLLRILTKTFRGSGFFSLSPPHILNNGIYWMQENINEKKL